MQYRFGTFTSPGTAAAQTITLGFVPSKFVLTNYTGYATNTVVSRAEFDYGMAAGFALIQTVNGSAIPVQSILASNGFTTFSTGASYTATNYTITGITKANPGVVTLNSVTGLVNGDTMTFSSVGGMIQVNEQRYIVAGISGSTFTMYDVFGNPVDTTAYGTYTSGGIANLISTPVTAATVNATTGQVTTPGAPPGLVLDTGSAGIILGTSLFRNNADVFYWEAFYQTPTGW